VNRGQRIRVMLNTWMEETSFRSAVAVIGAIVVAVGAGTAIVVFMLTTHGPQAAATTVNATHQPLAPTTVDPSPSPSLPPSPSPSPSLSPSPTSSAYIAPPPATTLPPSPTPAATTRSPQPPPTTPVPYPSPTHTFPHTNPTSPYRTALPTGLPTAPP
jgi:hypothetical protein